MPAPANLTQVTVTAQYEALSDGTAASGSVVFTPTITGNRLVDVNAAGGPLVLLPDPVTANLNNQGKISTPLIACDDPDGNPVGWTWLVDESGVKSRNWKSPGTWSLAVSINDVNTGIDLARVVPIDSSGGVFGAIAGVTSWQSKAGVITDAASTDLSDSALLARLTDVQSATSGLATTTYVQQQVAGAASTLLTKKTVTTATYTLVVGDHLKFLVCTNAAGCVITVPPSATTALPVPFYCEAAGTLGQVRFAGGGQLAIVVRGSNSNHIDTATTTALITLPAGIQNGDGVLITDGYTGGAAWTGLPSGFVEQGTQIGPLGARNRVFKAVNVSSALSNQQLSFTVAVSQPLTLCAIVLGNVDTTDFVGANADTGSNNSKTAPQVTTTVDNAGRLSLIAASQATPYSAPAATPGAGSNITKLVEAFNAASPSNYAACAIGYYGSGGVLSSVGAANTQVGGDTWTIAGQGNARTLAIKPAPPVLPLLYAADSRFTSRVPRSRLSLSGYAVDEFWVDGDAVP